MEQGRFAEALTALESWRKPGDAWVGYAKYNIGVALVRLGQVEAGARVLDEVGQLDPENPAFDALRDKANVALGYAWLQASRPVEAKPSLQRVRLEWAVLEQSAARRRLVRRGSVGLSCGSGALAGAARSQHARLGRAGIAAGGAVRVRAARRRQAGRRSLRRRDRRVQRRDRAAHELDREHRERRADHAAARRARRTSRTKRRAGTGASSRFRTRSRAAISTSSWRAIVSKKGSRTTATCSS